MLFVAALYSRREHFLEALESLVSIYGPVVMETPPLPWNHTGYYEKELGSPIWRTFAFFERLVPQAGIAAVKLATVELEGRLSSEGKRNVNLDPGYVTEAKVVLASTKDYSHRIYLGGGIFGEVTLMYVKDRFHPHVNTYADYKNHWEIFARARETLKGLLGRR